MINKNDRNKEKSDIIITKEYKDLLNKWINNKNNEYSLIYKGSRDGDSFDNFHEKCDNKGPTILIIESKDGEIFGGYTEKSWKKTDSIPSPESFLFNLNKKKKYSIKGKGYIISENFQGSQIGVGDNDWYELSFYNNYLNSPESTISGVSSYKIQDYEISGGKNKFIIKEMEVYEIK